MAAVAGIIAEYNPFHLGHARQLSALRHILGEDCGVVAAMSGNFVQRGECAVAEKHARAEAAVRCGVDLVLELPTAYAAATAEVFARGGVGLLAASGIVTHLCFGSEEGELAPLLELARCLEREDFAALLRENLAEGMGFAAARQRAAEAIAGGAAGCLAQPNANLGVEYLRALDRLGGGMMPLTIRRTGAGHDSTEEGECPSASLIRGRLRRGEPWTAMVPPASAGVLCRELSAGRAPASLALAERAILSALRRMDEAELRPYDGGGEGLYRRFYRAVHRGAALEEVLALAKTRRYSHARLRRLALAAWLGLPAEPEPLCCLRVLAANSRGRALLREMKETAALPVVTRPAGGKRSSPEIRRLLEAEERYTDLFALCCPVLSALTPGSEMTTNPVILREEMT